MAFRRFMATLLGPPTWIRESMEIRVSGLDESRHVTVTRDGDKVILTVGPMSYQDSVRIQLSSTDAFAVANALALLAESIVDQRSR